jgi:hypothetical protein
MKWLYIYGVDGLSVSGGGTIDGSGQQWWASTCKRKKTPVITDQPGFNLQPPNLSGLCTFLHPPKPVSLLLLCAALLLGSSSKGECSAPSLF